MTKDDYFVISYRILKYLYACFKSGEPADIDFIDPDVLKINRGYWMNIMESLSAEGYVKGVNFPKAAGNMLGVKFTDLKITEKGIDFLQNNSNMHKAIEALQIEKAIVPGI